MTLQEIIEVKKALIRSLDRIDSLEKIVEVASQYQALENKLDGVNNE